MKCSYKKPKSCEYETKMFWMKNKLVQGHHEINFVTIFLPSEQTCLQLVLYYIIEDSC